MSKLTKRLVDLRELSQNIDTDISEIEGFKMGERILTDIEELDYRIRNLLVTYKDLTLLIEDIKMR